MKDIGYVMGDSFRFTLPAVYKKEVLNSEGLLATVMLEKWGMVAAVEDGEDSVGRAKLRLLTPEELVERACTVATIAMQRFRDRGWTLELPEPILKETR